MIKLNYTTAFKALDNYIDAHNERNPKSGDKIKSAVTLAAKELIRIYGAFLIKADGVSPTCASDWPALRTNNCQLAKLCKCSTRSVQRYIHKLQHSGIITNKVFHGSNSSYALWISPEILLPIRKPDQQQIQEIKSPPLEKVPGKGTPISISTICRDTDFAGYSNNVIIDVEKLTSTTSSQSETGYAAGYSVAGHSGEESLRGRSGEKLGGDPIDPARAASLDFYVLMLWTMARNTIYQDRFVTAQQEAVVKRHLRDYYEPVTNDKLPRVHEIYAERIALVNKYLKKDPLNRYVQHPHRYFDVQNQSGFSATKKWWSKHNERKKEVTRQLILHAQVRKYNSNKRKDPSKQKPWLEVYRECEQRIGKLHDPALVQQFHAMILDPETFQKLHPNDIQLKVIPNKNSL